MQKSVSAASWSGYGGSPAAERPYAVQVYRDSVRCRKNRLPDGSGGILLGGMIGGGFLTAEERQDLTELARDGLAEHRLARRANALVLLDRGMSCEEGCC